MIIYHLPPIKGTRNSYWIFIIWNYIMCIPGFGPMKSIKCIKFMVPLPIRQLPKKRDSFVTRNTPVIGVSSEKVEVQMRLTTYNHKVWYIDRLGGFKYFFFIPIWGRFPFWLIFSKGLKPPTSRDFTHSFSKPSFEFSPFLSFSFHTFDRELGIYKWKRDTMRKILMVNFVFNLFLECRLVLLDLWEERWHSRIAKHLGVPLELSWKIPP